MDTTQVATFAGYTITIGTVASLLTQYVKKSYFPAEYRKLLCRTLVAVLCVGINAGIALYNGGSVGIESLVTGFFSYVVAAAEYDHLFS